MRLERFVSQARVLLTEGKTRLDFEPNNFDRFLSTYVMDLLFEEDIESIVAEAHRVLTSNGLLGIVSLTEGFRVLTRMVEKMRIAAYRISPVPMSGISSKGRIENPVSTAN